MQNERHTSTSTVTAADFVRSFARWRQATVDGPVFVTNHGRTTHVLLDVEQYEALQTIAPAQTKSANPFELADWIDEAIIVCDDNMAVESMNRVASASCQVPALECIGRHLYDCFPQLRASLVEIHMARTVHSNEPTSADIPSPLRAEDGWLRLQTFPLHGRNVLMFRDITEEVQRHRLADVKTALIKAMAVHNAVGYVRISMGGMIERVDVPFCDLLGIPEERLVGAKLIDLITREDRVAFKSQVEKTLAGEGPCRVESRFHSNRGTTEEVVVAMVQLKGAYGAEGAVLLLTPKDMRSDKAHNIIAES